MDFFIEKRYMERKSKIIAIVVIVIVLVVVAAAIAVFVLMFLKGDDSKNESTDTLNNPESFKALVHTERFTRSNARKPRLKQPLAKEKRGTKPVSYLDSYIDSSV